MRIPAIEANVEESVGATPTQLPLAAAQSNERHYRE